MWSSISGPADAALPPQCYSNLADCVASANLLPLSGKSCSEETVQIRIQSEADVDHHNAGVFENLAFDYLKKI